MSKKLHQFEFPVMINIADPKLKDLTENQIRKSSIGRKLAIQELKDLGYEEKDFCQVSVKFESIQWEEVCIWIVAIKDKNPELVDEFQNTFEWDAARVAAFPTKENRHAS